MTDFEMYIRHKAMSLAHENWNYKECADTFGVDYKNMCAYLSGRKELPLRLCFAILDYLGAKVVIFRGK